MMYKRSFKAFRTSRVRSIYSVRLSYTYRWYPYVMTYSYKADVSEAYSPFIINLK